MKLIGVDVGGTFTDVVFTDTDTNTTAIHKVPTTPDDPSRGVLQGLDMGDLPHGVTDARCAPDPSFASAPTPRGPAGS